MLHTTTQPATERAYEFVKENILSGRFEGSLMLSEGDVAGQLEMSRTPVREAFLRLEVEGFLKLYPKRGAMVTPINSQDIKDVYDAREVVNKHAARFICQQSPQFRQRLAQELDQLILKQNEALDAEDLAEYTRLDAEFHQVIMAAGDNKIFAQLAQSLREQQQRFTATILNRDAERARDFVAGHIRLKDALLAGDLDDYYIELHHHLNQSRNQL